MKFSVNVPDSVSEAVKEAAAAEGITPAEWTRRALLAALHPPEVTPAPNADPESTREDLDRTQAERDQMATEIQQIRAEIAHRDQLLAEKADEIGWLRGQVAFLHERVPLALPEKAGEGRRPWWRFWAN